MIARRTLPARTLTLRTAPDGQSAVWLQAGSGEGIARDRVAAHSVHCPDGTGECALSWTQVNLDRVPMTDPRGGRFLLAATLQPAGVLFDPPARLCVPNTGLLPGEQVELASFDHDLEDWVGIGTGTVSEDGLTICSDPGFGIVKSGWHGPYGDGPPGDAGGDGGDDGCPKEGGSGECAPCPEDPDPTEWCEHPDMAMPEPTWEVRVGEGRIPIEEMDANHAWGLTKPGEVEDAQMSTCWDSGRGRYVPRLVSVSVEILADFDFRCEPRRDGVLEPCRDCSSFSDADFDEGGLVTPLAWCLRSAGDPQVSAPCSSVYAHARCDVFDVRDAFAAQCRESICHSFAATEAHEREHVSQIQDLVRETLTTGASVRPLFDLGGYARVPPVCSAGEAASRNESELTYRAHRLPIYLGYDLDLLMESRRDFMELAAHAVGAIHAGIEAATWCTRVTACSTLERSP